MEALRQLPEATQNVIASEILDRVADIGSSSLDGVQDAEVRRRLAAPRRLADEAEMQRFFTCYGVKPLANDTGGGATGCRPFCSIRRCETGERRSPLHRNQHPVPHGSCAALSM